jgi:alpha-amylase
MSEMKLQLRSVFLLLVAMVLLTGCESAATPTSPPTPTAVPTLPAPAATATASPAAAASPTSPPAAAYTPTPEPQIDTPAWFADTIVYEVFVRSFYDSDGDGIGDLKGVEDKLEHVQGLHAGAIWLMPIHPSPSYHGYDVTDYLAVNPEYGTLDDMKALVQAAHERGIRVILDLVVNHTSDEHPFFQDAYGNPGSRYADWYLWSNDQHTAYQTFGGYQDMPKLNHENPAVVEYVIEIARFWMDLGGDGSYSGVDGFRCDVAIEVPLSTWQALGTAMREWNPESLLLGEVWDTNARNLARYYGAFDALFNFPLYGDLAGSHNVSQDSLLAGVQRPDMANLTLLAEDKLYPPGYQIVQFVNSHDTNRVMSDVGGDWVRAQTAATLLLTLPGTPMVYYGEEIGMQGEKGAGHPFWDEYRREPMDWYGAEAGPGMTTWFKPIKRFNAPDDGISVEEQAETEESLLELYRELGALRLTHPALRRGAYAPAAVKGSQAVYAYTRHAPAAGGSAEELFLVALNFGPDAQPVSLELSAALAGPYRAVDALTGEEWPDVPAGAPYAVELAGKSGAVLELSRP